MASASASSAPPPASDSGPWRICILATSTHDQETKKPYTSYTSSIHYRVPASLLRDPSQPTIDWTVSHRYSDFEALRAKLAEYSTQVPTLPGKSFFTSGMSPELVAQRKVGLDSFLQQCLQRPWITERPEWRNFLQVGANVPASQIYSWNPMQIKEVRNLSAAGASATYGVNDVLYIAEPLVLLLGMEEQRLLQKVDNVLSQIRMPWEKKLPLPRPLPLGAFKVYKVDSATKEWRLMCSVATESGVVCLAFAEETRTLYAGMDDGSVHVFRIDASWEDPVLVKELRNLHAPKERVTALSLHKRKQLLLSVSRDKQLAIYDLRKELVLSTTNVGGSVNASAWISALEVDEESELAFIGTYATFIHIYDVSTPTNPRLLHTLEGHTGSVRCLQYRNPERILLSGGFDGVAGIWNIAGPRSTPEAILRSRSVGWVKECANEKVKSVAFIPHQTGVSEEGNNNGSQGMVVVGQDAGYLSFFNVSSGRMKYALKAHAGNVVKLLYLEDAGVLISAGLDGICKFWAIPASASAGVESIGEQVVRGVESALGAVSLAASSAAASASSSSSSARVASPRKASDMSPHAPPPSMAHSSSALHKSSRADSTDGTTFSTSVAEEPLDHDASRSAQQGSFFEEDSDFRPNESTAVAPSADDAARRLFDAPAAASSSQPPSSIPEHNEDAGASDAIEVGNEPESDIF